ncbi:F-box only protein 4-like [Antedon mediterranea]|uniref:F-box only protein 4-like n=1 Tax=Antedon mediterranea TaxID=105859 RepID=UPI003AF64EC4
MFGNEETLAHVNQLLILQQKQENAMGFDFDSVVKSSYKLFASMYGESGIEGNTTEGQSTTSHQMSENQYNDDIVIMVEPSTTEISFNTFGILDLPVQVQLHIFSFLTAQDLSQASQSCRTWNDLCSDHLLWKRLLNIDQHQWNTVSHSTNPAVYRAVDSDLSQKEIYSRCCPHAQSVITGLRFSIPRLFRSLVLTKPPKIVMFGPGLECEDTSSIVRKFLGERPEIFKTCGGFPGEFPGSIGTGFYVKVENTFQIRLITLYSGTRKERENQNVNQRASRNKLLVAAAARDEEDIVNQENNGENPFDASHSVRALCRTVDAFIFVLNASTSATTSVSEGKPELLTIMNDRWTHPSIPLLILSCVKNDDVTRVSCITVADQLQLHNMNRVWKMYNCNIQTLDGVTDGIKWIKGAVDSR